MRDCLLLGITFGAKVIDFAFIFLKLRGQLTDALILFLELSSEVLLAKTIPLFLTGGNVTSTGTNCILLADDFMKLAEGVVSSNADLLS